MKGLNIAIFTDSFFPMRDGIVTSTISLIKGLSDRGHKIYVIAPKHRGIKEFSYPNVTVKRVRGIPALFYPGFKFTSPISMKLILYLKKKNIDIIHFQTPVSLGIQAIFTAKILKKPLIGTFHTFINDEEYIKHIGINFKFLQNFTNGYLRNYYNRCDLITCPSESARKELLKINFTKPIEVISNGIDLLQFDNSNYKKFMKKYKLRGKTLLFVGRIAYEKNIGYLLDCFKLVIKKIPEIRLLLIGGGPQMTEIKELVKELDLSEEVIFVGKMEHSKLIKSGVFKVGNIFVTASKTETQGITVLEAQANGMVCVAMDARGTKDLIKNGFNGYLVKDGDKKGFAKRIIDLFENKKLYNRMKKNTLKEVRKHNINFVIGQWENLYSRVIKNKEKLLLKNRIKK